MGCEKKLKSVIVHMAASTCGLPFLDFTGFQPVLHWFPSILETEKITHALNLASAWHQLLRVYVQPYLLFEFVVEPWTVLPPPQATTSVAQAEPAHIAEHPVDTSSGLAAPRSRVSVTCVHNRTNH
jgi:hypothetical protein